jgi:GNAT superfamily N-acetyltransferase
MATQPGPQLVSKPAAVTVRRATPEDAQVCGRIAYDAFGKVASDHNFPFDFPAVERAAQVLSMMFSHPGFYCVVAELESRIVGSNCLDERSAIAGVGPITIDPGVQNRRIGWTLMEAVLMRASERMFPGIRLLQAAYHNRSLSLYAKLGFVAREPISTMQGPPIKTDLPGYAVRAARKDDFEECNRLCQAVHGHNRAGELEDALKQGSAVVAERDGRITAYATALAFFGHAIGETNADLEALIASAGSFGGPGILVPTRNASLFRWCLDHGLRIVQPMTLMTIGLYNEPAGAYLPSILY